MDSVDDTVEVASLDGVYHHVIVNTGLVNPRGIAVHPALGRLYWSDWDRRSPRIESCHMDGSGRLVLVEGDGLETPNMLALDLEHNDLCWTDAGRRTVEYVNLNGLGRRVVYTPAQYPFGLAVAAGKVYWTDWTIPFIHVVDRNGGTAEPLKLPLGGNGKLYGITAVSEKCPQLANACSHLNGGYRHLCLPSGHVHQLLRSSDMANASTGANPIWNFFVKVPPGQEAQRLKCHSILKTPTGTTTTLATHLKRHPDVFVTYEKERCARKSVKSTAKPDVQQPSVADRFKPKLKHTAPKAQQMTKAIAGFIVRGMHSYSVVEEPGFVAVMNAAMPEYVVPSRTTFSQAIIPELYASKKQNLMNSLQAVIDGGVEAISITTDSWTSRANESYLSVTCHIMDSSFQLHVHALACTEMADAHTAENLVLFLKSVMEEWALPDPVVRSVSVSPKLRFRGLHRRLRQAVLEPPRSRD
ncbi:hypothetical protein HPB50_012119 [Hyalomma asiaticum]|uniref:Uncharacterized protein n=1 Tax=Hyalomma asiaticum TaxID=266040 RepID=A0ACB7S3A0_HYAAI|nr:hypothetical protein HPB50_012119 [Hyalomma asiaticum]